MGGGGGEGEGERERGREGEGERERGRERENGERDIVVLAINTSEERRQISLVVAYAFIH